VKSNKRFVDRFQTPIAGKLALAGLASVLFFLSGFAIWAARTTNEAAEKARISKELSDLYERARFSVAEERSLEREYRLQPFPGTQELFQQNSATFLDSLAEIDRIGDPTDLELVGRMRVQHQTYLEAIDHLFTAVDAGRLALVQRIHEEKIDPVFSDIEERIYTASFQHETEATESFALLEETQRQVRFGTLIAFAAGLALLATLIYVDHKRRLHGGEERFRSMVRSSSDAILIVGSSGTVMYQSRPLHSGAKSLDVVGLKFVDLVIPEDQELADGFIASLMKEDSAAHQELSVELLVGDGDEDATHCEVVGTNLIDNPNVEGVVLTLRDITERKQAEKTRGLLEAQLRQSQKMEAIGQLAGGVAHDFNNLLSVILNYTRFSIEDLPEGDQRRLDMEEVVKAADQATNLTQQLLAFSRKEVAQPTDLILNDIVIELENMLHRSLGEQVQLETVLDPDLSHVRVDKSQVQQIVMNLCVNGRDAMLEGGRLLLQTSNELVGGSLAEEELSPGEYVCLSVSDAGMGISEEVRGRIFEPFFTTKERGLGTGLGLSTVYGIVTQAGGHVTVHSELGTGTTFKVYLPAVSAPKRVIPSGASTAPDNGMGRTILVTEDEAGVRELVRRMLSRSGFEVLVAPSAKEALSILTSSERRIDVLLTDVVMPGLSGKELATLARKMSRDLPVVFMSGYTNDIIAKQGVLRSDEILLQKPFTEGELLAKVSDALTRSQVSA
jgi:PAS domain S-box-containing protein